MRKAGVIRKRADGRFEGRFTARDGRRRYVFARTYEDALERMKEAQAGADAGVAPVDGRTTVEQFVTRWVDTVVAPKCKTRTVDSYRETFARYVIPSIGRVRIAKLGPDHVRAMMAALAKTDLSPTTQKYAFTLLRAAIRHGYRDRVLATDVTANVQAPVKARVTFEPLTLEETKAFLSSLAGNRLEPLFAMAVATGMRQGELLALRWADVDLERGTVRVRHTLERRTRALAAPKTAGSVRDVPFADFAREALRNWSTRQKRERLAAGAAWKDRGLVFTTPVGMPLHGTKVTASLHAALRQAGLRSQRFHDLRHAHATLMLELGTPIEVVSRNLGHASIATTVDVYGHVTTERRRAASDLLGSALAGASAAVSG